VSENAASAPTDPPKDDKSRPRKTFYLKGLTITEEDVELGGTGGRCLRCNFTCPNSVTMETHVNTVHKKINPYECEYCDKAFAAKQRLGRHLKKYHAEEVKKLRRRRGSEDTGEKSKASKFKADGTRKQTSQVLTYFCSFFLLLIFLWTVETDNSRFL
jgi:hypothetical protein